MNRLQQINRIVDIRTHMDGAYRCVTRRDCRRATCSADDVYRALSSLSHCITRRRRRILSTAGKPDRVRYAQPAPPRSAYWDHAEVRIERRPSQASGPWTLRVLTAGDRHHRYPLPWIAVGRGLAAKGGRHRPGGARTRPAGFPNQTKRRKT